MLRLTGKSTTHCDGVTRREFLTAGSAGVVGLGLADLLREEELALLPVETLIILKNVLDQEISMGRTVH